MVQGGGVDGRGGGSGSGARLTESSDISRRIRSNLLERERESEDTSNLLSRALLLTVH